MTSYFVLFGFLLSLTNGDDLQIAVTNSLLGSIILVTSGFSNLALLLFLEKKLIINKTVHRRKYLLSSFILSYAVFLLVSVGYAYIEGKTLQTQNYLYIGVICIMINSMILAFQNFVILHDAKINADLENSNLKAANADAANQLLRQQIQPHFLFNALNILKSLYKVNPKTGEEYLIRLSDFLRAAVSNNNIKVIPLRDELKLCRDYLDMQKIRFGNALTCSINVPDELLNLGFVPSFSIQPLLENAIKHNELTEEAPLHIQIQDVGDRIRVTNKVKLKSTSETSTKSGLANLSERYKLISGDDLVIENDQDTFSVSIKILRHEDSNH
jgi:sensor histidine kinase YesM